MKAIVEIEVSGYSIYVSGNVILDNDRYIINDNDHCEVLIGYDGNDVEIDDLSLETKSMFNDAVFQWEKDNQGYLRDCWEDDDL